LNFIGDYLFTTFSDNGSNQSWAKDVAITAMAMNKNVFSVCINLNFEEVTYN